MSTTASPAFSIAKLFPRRRVLFTLAVVLPLGLLLGLSSLSPTLVVVARGLLVGLFAMLAYGVFEQWPARLPARLARWVLQLVAVVIAVPVGALVAYWITIGGDPQFGQNPARLNGYLSLTVLGGWSRPGSRSARWCAARGAGARPGAGVRARAQRAGAPGARRAPAAAAGAGRSRISCSTRSPTCRRWSRPARRRPRACSTA